MIREVQYEFYSWSKYELRIELWILKNYSFDSLRRPIDRLPYCVKETMTSITFSGVKLGSPFQVHFVSIKMELHCITWFFFCNKGSISISLERESGPYIHIKLTVKVGDVANCCFFHQRHLFSLPCQSFFSWMQSRKSIIITILL